MRVVVKLLSRSTVVWVAILIVAVANGALREGLLVPALGVAIAHIVSTLLLSAAVLVVTWWTITWIQPAGLRQQWSTGAYWLGLTVAFEFLAGHYLFGTSWQVLLADYEITEGRIWPLVLIVTLVAPALTVRLQNLSGSAGARQPA